MKPTAIFIGYQEALPPDEAVPLFNIRGDHPKRGSTVGADTLVREGIHVPHNTPSYAIWLQRKASRVG